jgi:hypothetical protein
MSATPLSPAILADYMTRNELAAEIGVCWRTIKRWCDRGDGPPITRIGMRPLYKRSSVVAWLASRESRAA